MKKATTSEASLSFETKAPAKRAPASSARKPKKTAETPVAVQAAPAASVTAVIARINVGFGNLLYLRGEGPGLSWERGVPMDCASSDLWTWSTAAATRPFAYKVLINDERWSIGDDYVASVGVENTVEPAF
jgi:hypothetical protein